MISNFSTIDYFAKSLKDPMHEVFVVFDNKEHHEHINLVNDLNSLNQHDLHQYVKDNCIDDFIHNASDKDAERKLYYFVHLISQDVARHRIEKLIEPTERPAPYHLQNLYDVICDKNHLVSMNQFNTDNFGFERNKLVYVLCPVLEQSNSSYWIFHVILRLAREKKLNLKIRLDPFIEIPLNDYRPMSYKMFVHGKTLDWDRLTNLRGDEYGQWMDEKEYKHMGYTDFIWSPKKDEIHFTCEELPKRHNFLRTSRYFHAIFNKNTGMISHCDGAIRYYSEDELQYRSDYHVKDPEVRKIGKRIKIFGFESNDNDNKEIDQDTFCTLAVNFFVWNNDVQKYFNE